MRKVFPVLLLLVLVVGCTPRADYKQGEVIVRFKPGISDATKFKIITRYGSLEDSTESTTTIKIPNGMSVEDAVKKLNAESAVESATPNYLK